jgi:mannose-1-phosphate guanylyltransferase
LLRITPVILSGGGGTRLWPMSRPECPKQFLALTGELTMFHMTLERVRSSDQFAPPIIVANAAHTDMITAQLLQIGLNDARLLLEPCARNTAPAIALAALAAPNPKAPLLVMPSDHVIKDLPAFHHAITAVLPMVEQGWMATFGITPGSPETGYGYIQTGEEVAPGVHRVARFIEKPNVARAIEMISSGGHVWNGGIFLFRADAYLDALGAHAPDILAAARAAIVGAKYEGSQIHPDSEAFAACPADSIDYAVMEKAAMAESGNVAVIPVSMGWSDVGSWDALYDLGLSSVSPGTIEIDGANNLIRSDGIRIHTAGVNDMIIVASGNDILIVPRGQSQDVKKIVDALKTQMPI